MTGLILQKGVPLTFRNDEASEFVKGVVAAMNRYLGIVQVTTGSHNPRRYRNQTKLGKNRFFQKS